MKNDVYINELEKWKTTYEDYHNKFLNLKGFGEYNITKRFKDIFTACHHEEKFEQCQAMIDAWKWYKNEREPSVIKEHTKKDPEISKKVKQANEILDDFAVNIKEELLWEAITESVNVYLDGVISSEALIDEFTDLIMKFDEKRN